MSLPRRSFPQIEALEARIAPAIVITNPLPDLQVGPGKTGASIDLSQLTQPASSSAYHTKVKFITNDLDPDTAGDQVGEIVIELLDDVAPRTVQNFLNYLTSTNPNGDYDGTIFHRSAYFGASTAPDPDGDGPLVPPHDIIQGGGFNFPGFAHVATLPELFNEYNPAYPNAAGTIAVAKTGLGPSTGTSEWFFNVNDNSKTLGGPELETDGDPTTNNNNGGYAVFGKVISGMDVVQKIASVATRNLGGAFTEIPVQGYTSGVPTENQVFRIVDAQVLPATPAPTTLTYSISHIYKVGAHGQTAVTSDAVKGAVNGSTLNLNYVAGKSGVADVVVKVTEGTDTTEETFRVDLRPNLFLIDNGTQVIVPGDNTPLNFKVINDGARAIAGTAAIELFLQRTDIPGTAPIPLGVKTAPISIASGGAQILTVKTPIPPTLATSPNETYQVVAKIVELAAERDGADNTSSGGSHQLVNQFGTVEGRANVVLKSSNTNGLMTWTMAGGGTGGLIPDAAGHFTLKTAGTSLASTMTAVSSKITARQLVAGIELGSPLGTANLGTVDVAGLIVAPSGIKKLTLGDLSGDSLLLIGAVLPDNATKTAIALRTVSNFSIESDMPISTLTVGSWTDTADSPNDTIKAPSLDSLKVNGNFNADVNLTENALTTAITITGQMKDSTFKTAGNIGAINVGGINSSSILAGVSSRPISLADFAEARSIQSFTITGSGTTDLFVNSLVAAQTLGTIKVKGVKVGDTGPLEDYGFVADVIRSYSRLGGPTKTNVTTPPRFDDLGDYVVEVL